ncbi:hypothetical protein BS78_02G145300 [Paspalum vaginatum]|nr:hypothetical protein BS78_02G145300 [Paspalum vaginatum]
MANAGRRGIWDRPRPAASSHLRSGAPSPRSRGQRGWQGTAAGKRRSGGGSPRRSQHGGLGPDAAWRRRRGGDALLRRRQGGAAHGRGGAARGGRWRKGAGAAELRAVAAGGKERQEEEDGGAYRVEETGTIRKASRLNGREARLDPLWTVQIACCMDPTVNGSWATWSPYTSEFGPMIRL